MTINIPQYAHDLPDISRAWATIRAFRLDVGGMWASGTHPFPVIVIPDAHPSDMVTIYFVESMDEHGILLRDIQEPIRCSHTSSEWREVLNCSYRAIWEFDFFRSHPMTKCQYMREEINIPVHTFHDYYTSVVQPIHDYRSKMSNEGFVLQRHTDSFKKPGWLD